jgi:CRISPR system Cascade subunit CasE
MLDSCLEELAGTKTYTPSFQNGQKLYFLLRVNPSVKKEIDGKRNGFRVGLLKEEDQLKWLQRKAEAGGFSINSCRAIPEGIIHDERGKEEAGKLRHYAVRFEGTLQVVNPDLFLAAIQSGIGPAKGFGFGLLSIAPSKV